LSICLSFFHIQLLETALADGVLAVERQRFGALAASWDEVALFE